jgi:glycine cleavage system H lipoate-binding protein
MSHAEDGQADSRLDCCTISNKEGVQYTQNHMWVDVHEDRSCHIGIDAFLAKFLRDVERLSFVTTRPVCRPTAVITVRGIDLQLSFPDKIQITGVNAYLRARPSSLITHPYTLGWLFEGVRPAGLPEETELTTGTRVIRSDHARQWLKQESRRMTDYVRGELVSSRNKEFATMADGGTWSEDLITHLTREETLQVWNEFFSISVDFPTP